MPSNFINELYLFITSTRVQNFVNTQYFSIFNVSLYYFLLLFLWFLPIWPTVFLWGLHLHFHKTEILNTHPIFTDQWILLSGEIPVFLNFAHFSLLTFWCSIQIQDSHSLLTFILYFEAQVLAISICHTFLFFS